MQFVETKIPGVFLIESEPRVDERGLFARTYCQREFASHGISPTVVQCGASFSPRRGTLRGLHYQAAPHAEEKLVRVTRGAVYDVVVDLREESATLHEWVACELSADNRRMVHIPKGCAHGLLTLSDDTEVYYQMSAEYHAASARGVRWDDPELDIRWPHTPRIISDRDRCFPLLEPAAGSRAC